MRIFKFKEIDSTSKFLKEMKEKEDYNTAIAEMCIRDRLYDLTTLQREANRMFGYTAQQTLDAVQEMYEQKLVTYPRTDSQYLTDEMLSLIHI